MERNGRPGEGPPPGEDQGYRRRLEQEKRNNVGQLLFKAARLLNDEALRRVRARTRYQLRASHTALFPHIDLAGTRLTTLADRLGVTKQAAGQLVEELEALGVLERAPDPTDGRAKLIRFSARGRRGLLHGLGVLRQIEQELSERLGAPRLRAFHQTLLMLVDELERRAASGRLTVGGSGP